MHDAAVQAYYTKNKKTYATPATREVRHILVKDKALADRIYSQLSASDAQFAALAKKYTIDPGSKKNGGQARQDPEGPDRPERSTRSRSALPTGKVATPVKSAYGWHVIEATAATVPATQKPLNAALKKHDPRHPPDPEEAERRQQVVRGLPEEDREERALRGGPRAAQDDEHGDDRDDSHGGDHGGMMRRADCVGPARPARRRRARRLRRAAARAARCPRASSPSSAARTSRSPQLETTLHIAKLSLKTNYPTPGTDEWITLRTRALEALAHDAELRAWARNLGVTREAGAVDAAVKQTLAERVPGQDGGQHRPGQGRRPSSRARA